METITLHTFDGYQVNFDKHHLATHSFMIKDMLENEPFIKDVHLKETIRGQLLNGKVLMLIKKWVNHYKSRIPHSIKTPLKRGETLYDEANQMDKDFLSRFYKQIPDYLTTMRLINIAWYMGFQYIEAKNASLLEQACAHMSGIIKKNSNKENEELYRRSLKEEKKYYQIIINSKF